jgi:O-antigen ligase
MGTTLALIAGVLAAIIIISIFDHFKFIKKYLLKILFITAVFLGVGLIILYQNDKYKEHFEKIITGRAEKSSGGRFYLWERGIDAFKEHNVFLWGVGPENFREVDPTGNDNQLHNDILAFTVERGLIGVAGLFLFVGTALGRAIFLLLTYNKYPKETGQYVFVFLAGLISVLIVSLTHQIFHARELWIVFALQEAVVYKTNEEIYTASLLK